jgi:hypothetical protein
MVYGGREFGGLPMLEHRSTRGGRWLRERRLRIALWIAVVEGVLLVFHVIPRFPALLVAALVIVAYLGVRRMLRPAAIRQAGWIAFASQVFVALIPALLLLVGALALVALTILALVALFVLFSDRG